MLVRNAASLRGSAGRRESRAEFFMCFGQIRCQRECPCRLGQRTPDVAAALQRVGETGVGIRIGGGVERHRAARRRLGQLLGFGKRARPKIVRRIRLRPGQAAIPAREGPVESDRPRKKPLRENGLGGSVLAQMPEAALIGTPGVEARRRLARRAVQLGIGNGRRNGSGYHPSNVVLQRKDVGQFAVVMLDLEIFAGFSLDQPRSDARPVAGLAQTAFDQITRAEFARDLLHPGRPALEQEGRAADHEQRWVAA
jgi:hypothetical protein